LAGSFGVFYPCCLIVQMCHMVLNHALGKHDTQKTPKQSVDELCCTLLFTGDVCQRL
jgi:hypothetical protein